MIKIKLIIILFGISCLFFPAELMEVEAGMFDSIIKGIAKVIPKVAKGIRGAGDDVAKGAKGLGDDPHAFKPLKELGDTFKEYDRLEEIGKYDDNIGGELALEIKENLRNYKQLQQEGTEEEIGDSQEPNEIRFKELRDEKYRYNISTPEFWPPYNAKSYFVSIDPEYEAYNEIILFTDDPDGITSDAGWYTGGFILYIEESPEEIPEIPINVDEEIENVLREMCNETPTTCSDFRIIESEVTGEAPYVQIKIKYSVKIRADTSSLFIPVIEQLNVISNDDFVYTLHFGNEKNKFAAYAVLYDHIEDSFFADEPPDYFITILIAGIAGLVIIYLTSVKWRAKRFRERHKIEELTETLEDESRS